MKKSKILKTALTVLMGSSIFNGATVYGSSHTTTQEAVGNQQIYLGDGDTVTTVDSFSSYC